MMPGKSAGDTRISNSASQHKGIFVRFMTMRERQILVRIVEIHKEN